MGKKKVEISNSLKGIVKAFNSGADQQDKLDAVSEVSNSKKFQKVLPSTMQVSAKE